MPRTPLRCTWTCVATMGAVIALAAADGPRPYHPRPEAAGALDLAFREDFEADDLSGWQFTDPKAWRLARDHGNRVLDQYKASKYEPEVRSPLNIALVKKLDLGDFVMDLDVHSTGRDYGHRDVCLFFGYQDPSHFYYVHLGKQADDHANSIFIVDGAPRKSIAESRTKGTPWTEGWHHVRVVRKAEDGRILVFFDLMTKPVMTAHDKTFAHGRIGIGSFDDTAQFDVIQVWGAREKPPS